MWGAGQGMVMLSLEPINEVKLVALLFLLAAALLTGLVTGAVLGWRHGGLGKLAGLALGLGVGVLAVVVVVAMLEEPDQPAMVLMGPVDTGTLTPGDPGVEVRYSIPANGPLNGEVTLIGALLYPIRVGAVIVCTRFATVSLWSLIRMGARFVRQSL